MEPKTRCQMDDECAEPVTMIDNKGFVYCTEHGLGRRLTCGCRKLRQHEQNRIRRGEPLTHY
jgi:hypothetical protein